MPRKSQFRRVRRLRLAGRGGLIAIGLGLTAIFSSASDALHDHAGGWEGVAVGLVLVTSGISAETWAIRASRRAMTSDRRELRARNLDDGLPMGAFMQNERVGLEAADLWLALGILTTGVGLLFAVAGATDPQVGWKFGLAFSLVGLIPATLCFRVGTGTKYWFTPDGIETNRWPRRSVRWTDVERIVPLWRGQPALHPESFDAVELQTAKPVQGVPRWWPGTDLSIKAVLVEIGRHDLLSMIQELAHPDRTIS